MKCELPLDKKIESVLELRISRALTTVLDTAFVRMDLPLQRYPQSPSISVSTRPRLSLTQSHLRLVVSMSDSHLARALTAPLELETQKCLGSLWHKLETLRVQDSPQSLWIVSLSS